MKIKSHHQLGVCVLPMALSVLSADVGAAEEAASSASRQRYAEVISVFEERGILTSRGHFVVEPSLAFAHSTSTNVTIEGLTIIPALIVGLIDVNQTQRDITTAAISMRTGITSRLEVALKIPYLNVDESIRQRKALEASPVDIVNDTHGQGLGDVELSFNYQLNGGAHGSFYVVNLRIKSDTGQSVFEVDRRTIRDERGNDIGVVLGEQPTGSGFWAVQPGLTMIIATDPAVLYGSFNYLWNIKEDKGPEFGRTINPGDAVGVSFGIGFAINELTSFSLGYDHNVISKTKIESYRNRLDSVFDRIHSGSFLFGISRSTGKNSSFNMSLGIGATEEAPDMQLTLRMPYSF